MWPAMNYMPHCTIPAPQYLTGSSYFLLSKVVMPNPAFVNTWKSKCTTLEKLTVACTLMTGSCI